jgi:hypothetical protein
MRGGVCGGTTTLGGIGHTLSFLLSNFWVVTWIAVAVVAVELAAISWIRNRYMDTPLLGAPGGAWWFPGIFSGHFDRQSLMNLSHSGRVVGR